MWKESYKLGNKLIDAQHEELFNKTEKLLSIVNNKDFLTKKQECIDTILFLKDYAVNHFAAEEEFQASVGYVDFEMHTLIHKNLVDAVLEAERKLVSTDFSLPTIKEFCGFLTAWLIYHVAGADQKIVQNKELSYDEMIIILSPQECFLRGIEDVFATMLGEAAQVEESTQAAESKELIRIKIEPAGNWKKDVFVIFSKETALNLVNALTDLGLTEIDELAYSALNEMSATIVNKAVSLMSESEEASEAQPSSDFVFNTKHGKITISFD